MNWGFAKKSMTAVIATVALLSALPAFAASPYLNNAGFNTNTLPASDDDSTGAVNIGFSLKFYGFNYTQLFVNNNGNITFNGPLLQYTPSGLAVNSGLPIIAPFFADVDTRGPGSGLVKYGTDTVNGHAAFGVNSANVGYFNAQTDKFNTFQMILVERSDIAPGDFDIMFNYTQIKWETGSASGGANGFGGTSAAVGYSAGTGVAGTFDQLPGSFANGALVDGGVNALVSHSNVGVAGQYVFGVRNGVIINPPTVPLPTSVWAGLVTLGALGGLKILSARKLA